MKKLISNRNAAATVVAVFKKLEKKVSRIPNTGLRNPRIVDLVIPGLPYAIKADADTDMVQFYGATGVLVHEECNYLKAGRIIAHALTRYPSHYDAGIFKDFIDSDGSAQKLSLAEVFK